MVQIWFQMSLKCTFNTFLIFLGTVTVIVRVTRVNEFEPNPSPNVFYVFENSPVDSLVGTTKFTDIDWPFDNIKFTFAGGDYGNPPKFYIEPETGETFYSYQLLFYNKL